MSRNSFVHAPAPMIVGVIRQRTPRDAIAEIKNGEYRGARGFDLHLDALDEEFRNVESIRTIAQATDRPILALNYKNGYFGPLTMSEEERIDLLMTAVDAGVSAVDLQGYSFYPEAKGDFVDAQYIPDGLETLTEKKPKEVTFAPDIVQKQKEFIDEVHARGAEVVMSMHFGVHLATDELRRLACFAHEVKGADMVKMVTPCESRQQLAEVLYSTVMLHESLDFPFSYHASGKMGVPSRYICPMLGSYIMFCNVEYGYSSNMEQLHLKSMTDAYRALGLL